MRNAAAQPSSLAQPIKNAKPDEVLHLHTCGAYAPGEISWNMIDPMIVVDGVAVWKGGVLHPEAVPGGREILLRYPSAKDLFDAPGTNIGL